LKRCTKVKNYFLTIHSSVHINRARQIAFSDLRTDSFHLFGLSITRPYESSNIVPAVEKVLCNVCTDSPRNSRY
jgi:hypothetical protein